MYQENKKEGNSPELKIVTMYQNEDTKVTLKKAKKDNFTDNIIINRTKITEMRKKTQLYGYFKKIWSWLRKGNF